MTHSLHRTGVPESLAKDYVVLSMPSSGLNSAGSAPKLKRFVELALKYNPVNIGDSKRGSRFSLDSDADVLNNIKDNIVVHAVFTRREDVIGFIKDLVQENLGMSVVVSGLFHEVWECCSEAGPKPHTVVQSLGVWGNTSLLPEPGIRDITTMCGHGLISVNLVKDLKEKIENNRMDVKKATEILAKPCICGIFNPVRAEELLKEMIGQ